MGQAAYVRGTQFAVDRHIGRISAARRTSAVLEAVRAYLSSWPAERVARLQCVDAGWAPFDEHQQPLRVNTVADIEDVFRDVHQHCMALRKSGLDLCPELLELDWVLLFAHQRLLQSHDARPRVEEHRAG